MNSEHSIPRRNLLKVTASSMCLFGLGLISGKAGSVFGPTVAWAAEGLESMNDQGEGTFLPQESLIEDDLLSNEPLAIAGNGITVLELKGSTRYETAAKEALQAYSKSTSVIVACGESYADSVAVGGLAGALQCPILLSGKNWIPEVTTQALDALDANTIIVLGGHDVISSSVETALRKYGAVTRLAGPTRYETQMAIFEYGRSRGYWTGDTAIVATGEGFADALAMSPVAFALKAPVFFCSGSGVLPEAQQQALSSLSGVKKVLIAGGTHVISSTTESHIKKLGKQAVRLGGEWRYQTSAAIAQYAVNNLGFTWEGVAFTTGSSPYDALAGSPLQGKYKAPLLLVDAGQVVAASAVGQASSSITFLGGYQAVALPTRVAICTKLGVKSYANVSLAPYNISMYAMADLEASGGGANGITSGQFLEMLDPNNVQYGTQEYYQFAVLTNGYSGMSAAQLDSYIAYNCAYSESSYGRTSGLRGMGTAFIEAAKTYGINEVYLLSHAIWESGWGCSELASGWTPDKDGTVVVNGKSYPYYQGTTYYNFYGIGAYDSNALSGGRAMAVKQGWTSPKLAVLGAASWILSNYLNRAGGPQNTLYLMKFDVIGAAKGNGIWHQYCTGGNTWVLGISRVMHGCYVNAGRSFESNGLSFSVPSYNG